MHRGILRTNLSSLSFLLSRGQALSWQPHLKDSPELQEQSRTEPGLPEASWRLRTPAGTAPQGGGLWGGLRVGAGSRWEGRGIMTVLTYVGMVQNLHYSYFTEQLENKIAAGVMPAQLAPLRSPPNRSSLGCFSKEQRGRSEETVWQSTSSMPVPRG